MISAESEVIERHLDFLRGKSLLLAGAMLDDFLPQLQAQGIQTKAWSWYFHYTRDKQNAIFSAQFPAAELLPMADLIVFYWSKNKLENQFQLNQLLAQCQVGQQVLLVGENRSGIRSAEKMLAALGELHKSDSARRCSLYHFTLQKVPEFCFKDFWQQYALPQLDLTVYSLPGVFSANALDDGSALLLSTIKAPMGDVLDLGCGAGVIGSFVKKQHPRINLTMSDVHAMALESARQTLQQNGLQGEVLASDVFSEINQKFDLILSNPPFHDGRDTAYQAVTTLIEQAKWKLKSGGELRIVANSHLPYPELLNRHFGNYQILAQTNKFKVYSVRN